MMNAGMRLLFQEYQGKTMKVSVITVCWNSEKTLRYTLDSFFAQSYPNKEIVIVDGASKDRTLEIARSYPQELMLVHCEPDKGIYDAMNKGLRRFTGDAVGTLNSDDCFHDTKALERVAEALERADATCGDLRFVDNHENKRVVRKWTGSPVPRSGFRFGWMPAHPTFYVRRRVAETVGLFDTSFRIASDYDWMLRAIEIKGFRPAYIPHTLVDMMVGGASTADLKSKLTIARECLRARQKWLGSGPVDAALFGKPLRQLQQLFVWGQR